MKDYRNPSDATLSQTQAKNEVRQYLRIIPHQKCEKTVQCQEEKSTHTFTEMVSLGLVFAWFAGVFLNFHRKNKNIN